MAAILGKIDEYDADKEDWQQYVERLEHFFIANSITTAEKKRAVLVSVVGATTYRLLRNLCTPDKPGDKTYEELVQKLTVHYKPTPSEMMERFKFHSRFRKQGESVATFISQLRALAEYCNFGETLEPMLRDRLVCGIGDDATQKRLLAEPVLTYKKATELALSMERAVKNVRELKQSAPSREREQDNQVHSIRPWKKDRCTRQQQQQRSHHAQPPSKPITCFRCGDPTHLAPKCKIDRHTVCQTCGKTGHLSRVCMSTSRQQMKPGGVQKGRYPHSVRRVQEDIDDDEDDDLNPLYLVRASKMTLPPIQIQVRMDDCQVNMEVDTGASMSLMSENTFRELWPGRSLDTTEVRLCTYSKQPIQVVGSANGNLSYKGRTPDKLPLLIVQGSGPTLLGRNWLTYIKLDWNEIHQVQCDSLRSLLAKYPSIFQEGSGKHVGFTAKIHVNPNAQPRFHRARAVPYALRDKVDAEIQRLLDEGTLEPVESSEWAAPIVAVLKGDKTSIRICGDFRVTINPVSKLDRYPIPKVEDLFATLQKGETFTKLDLSQAYQQLPLDEESKKYTVINTNRGLFRYTRLPFGISSASRE